MDLPWLIYDNKSAIRNDPLSKEMIAGLSSFIPQMGLTVKVFSGGQENNTTDGTGSTRHNHGNAGDLLFYKDGRKLDWNNPDDLPIFMEIVKKGRQAGFTGFGAGPNYMQPGSMHVGFGNPAYWGAGGDTANAPAWLKSAFEGGVPGSTNTPVVASQGGAYTAGEYVPSFSYINPAGTQIMPAGSSPAENKSAGILSALANMFGNSQPKMPYFLKNSKFDDEAKKAYAAQGLQEQGWPSLRSFLG